MSDKPTLTLIDGSAYIYRAYHAIPSLSTSKGQPTNAVYGFANLLMRALRERAPGHVAVVFDARGKTFRNDLDPGYKAHRPAPPDDLVSQFGLIRQVTDALGVPRLEVEGVEADDVIATMASQAVKDGFRVLIVTGDKDFMQLVNDDIELFDGMQDKHTTTKDVIAKLGIKPEQVVDYMSLVGDAVDNVIGLDGVGPKTASKLIQDHGSLENVIKDAAKITKPKLREQVQKNEKQLRLNKQLVQLKLDVPLKQKPDDLKRSIIEQDSIRALFAELEFSQLLRNLPPPPQDKVVASATQAVVVRDEAELKKLVHALEKAEHVAIRVVAPPGEAAIGIAIAAEKHGVHYVPVGHHYLGVQQLPKDKAWAALKPLLEGPVKKSGHHLKSEAWALRRAGVHLAHLDFDVELASFLLNAARRDHELADLSRERLARELPAEILETGKKAHPLHEVEIERAAAWAGAGAEAILAMQSGLEKELAAQSLTALFREMEMPLVPILLEMEAAGILVDTKKLGTLGAKMDAEITKLLAKIYELAGHEFNVGSNQQLAKVLFEELKLPAGRKTKTGYSVDVETMEKLGEQHPLPAVLLEHRSLAKLKSTYLDTLPQLVDAEGRVHTTFNQLGAATGRLSSTDPNLQNIPIRTDVGREIRDAFIAKPGHFLVSADYSQIELRILAHISDDAALLDAFKKDQDVHTRTAADIYGVALELVSPEMRRNAKAVNFGIAYGQSAFGLSQRLGIEPEAAQKIIDKYFERYSGVKTWLLSTIETAKKEVQVSTIFGRRRSVADILSKNPSLRQGAERIAVNTPIQGTAADIVKKAMIRVDAALKAQKLHSRVLLQVHDELLFEVPEKELKKLSALAVEAMEGAAQLKVRLKVEVGHSHSWGAAH